MTERGGRGGDEAHELYDLEGDSGETRGKAERHTDLVARLAAALQNERFEGRTRPKG